MQRRGSTWTAVFASPSLATCQAQAGRKAAAQVASRGRRPRRAAHAGGQAQGAAAAAVCNAAPRGLHAACRMAMMLFSISTDQRMW